MLNPTDFSEESSPRNCDRCINFWKRSRDLWIWLWSTVIARKGVLAAIVSGCMLGAQLAVVRAAVSTSPYQVMFYRSFPFLPFVLFVSWNNSLNYGRLDLVLYFFHSVFNSAGLLLSYVALEFAKLGNVSTICSNFPAPSAILGYLILNEHLTYCDVVILCVNFFGILFVTRPSVLFHSDTDYPENSEEFLGAMIALLGLLGFSLSGVCARKIAHRGNSDPMLLTFLPGMSGIIISGTVSLMTESWNLFPSFEELILCILVGVISLSGMVGFVVGLKYESVTTVSVFMTMATPVAFLLGILWHGEVPDWSSVVGAILIMCSTFGFLWSHTI